MVWVKTSQIEIEKGDGNYKHHLKQDAGYFYDELEQELKEATEEKNQSMVDVSCSGCGNMIFKNDNIWGNRFKPLCQDCSYNHTQSGNLEFQWDEEFGEWQSIEKQKIVEGILPTALALICDQCRSVMQVFNNEAKCHNELCSSNKAAVPGDKPSLQNGSCQGSVLKP